MRVRGRWDSHDYGDRFFKLGPWNTNVNGRVRQYKAYMPIEVFAVAEQANK